MEVVVVMMQVGVAEVGVVEAEGVQLPPARRASTQAQMCRSSRCSAACVFLSLLSVLTACAILPSKFQAEFAQITADAVMKRWACGRFTEIVC